jgi:hypothetical protein
MRGHERSLHGGGEKSKDKALEPLIVRPGRSLTF